MGIEAVQHKPCSDQVFLIGVELPEGILGLEELRLRLRTTFKRHEREGAGYYHTLHRE
jgi:hypothetical protein